MRGGAAFVTSVFAALFATGLANAALIPPVQAKSRPERQPSRKSAEQRITRQLDLLRKRVMVLEGDLVDGLHATAQARSNIRKIRVLLRLQKQERALGEQRLRQLQSEVEELGARKANLDEKILEQRDAIRRSLIAVERSIHIDPERAPEQEKWEAPRRKALAALVDRGIKQIEAMRIDVEDADEIERTIGDEQQQLSYMVHDLDEQQGVLKLNQALQADVIHKRRQERVAQLENYHKLKSAESQVEDLVTNFNARVELEKETESERLASQAAYERKLEENSLFARSKGKLLLPIPGAQVLTRYGRAFDPRSGLYVFQKGIEIKSDKKQAVRAIFSGKVAFSGELPDYGRVTIIDHGDHFYSICAHLGSLLKKAGDKVASGEMIGQTDDSGTPVYFEIRSRNVAVNPLQWVSN